MGFILKKEAEWDAGLDPRIVVAVGQPSIARHSADMPITALLEPNMHHWEGLMGAEWLPMGFCVPLSPNDHPS